MTKKEFHSFVKLVIKMYNTQQESYKKRNGDSNLVAKCKALENRVSKGLADYREKTEIFYKWQQRFIEVLKQLRAEQAMYYATKQANSLARCKQHEQSLGNAIIYINTHSPEVFEEEAKQTTLL